MMSEIVRDKLMIYRKLFKIREKEREREKHDLRAILLRIFDETRTHARAWIQRNFLPHPPNCGFHLYIYVYISFSLFLSYPYPSLARFSNAWHERHTRAALLTVHTCYKEATLRRTATVPRSSSRRAQPSSRYPRARVIARHARPARNIAMR